MMVISAEQRRMGTSQNQGKIGIEEPESGAVLVLAMMFMALTALIVGGLAAFSGNGINNLGHFKTARSATYAADGAVQASIYGVRYSYEATSNSGSFCGTNNSPAGTPPTPFTIDQTAVYVWCTWGPASINRQSTFSAYPAAQCTLAPCLAGTAKPSGNPYLTAQVSFDDLDTSGNLTSCQSTTNDSSCGLGMTIVAWTIQPGIN